MFELIVNGHMKHMYSGRDIAESCKTDIRFMWLLNGEPAPSHATISRFQDERLAEVIEGLYMSISVLTEENLNSEERVQRLPRMGIPLLRSITVMTNAEEVHTKISVINLKQATERLG